MSIYVATVTNISKYKSIKNKKTSTFLTNKILLVSGEDTSSKTSPVEPITTAVPELEPEIKSETVQQQLATEPTTSAVSSSSATPEPTAEPEPESEPEPKSAVEGAKAAAEEASNPEPEPEANPEPETQPEAESKPEPEPEPESAAAEPEPEPEAEPKPELRSNELEEEEEAYPEPKVAGGSTWTPRGDFHGMDCTDMVIGMARGSTSRVWDFYTRYLEKLKSKQRPVTTTPSSNVFFMYFIQHCFICRPSDSTVSEDAGIEPGTVAT